MSEIQQIAQEIFNKEGGINTFLYTKDRNFCKYDGYIKWRVIHNIHHYLRDKVYPAALSVLGEYKSSRYRNQRYVMEVLRICYYEIILKCNSHVFPFDGKNCLAFTNGVFDLDSREFRNGNPEDLILNNYLTYDYKKMDTTELENYLSVYGDPLVIAQKVYKLFKGECNLLIEGVFYSGVSTLAYNIISHSLPNNFIKISDYESSHLLMKEYRSETLPKEVITLNRTLKREEMKVFEMSEEFLYFVLNSQ